MVSTILANLEGFQERVLAGRLLLAGAAIQAIDRGGNYALLDLLGLPLGALQHLAVCTVGLRQCGKVGRLVSEAEFDLLGVRH